MNSISIQQEIVNDENRIKCTLVKSSPIDFVAESKALLSAISKYNFI